MVWIIDPLDGTTNFLHGFPVFAVSIAVEQRGRLEIGTVYDPMRQEIFTAVRGAGRTSRTAACASASSARSKARCWPPAIPTARRARGRWLFRHVARTLTRHGGHTPPGFGGTVSGLCRRRAGGWFLGTGTQALGYGGGNAVDPGGRRPVGKFNGNEYRLGQHRRGCAKSVRGAHRDLRPACPRRSRGL